MLVFGPDNFTCNATNVSSAQRNVTVELINGQTAAVAAQIIANLEPGHSTSLGVTSGYIRFCKIAVNNGVKTDVRGAMAIYGGAGSQSDRNPIAAQ